MATPTFRLRHVLCPTDFSEFSELALRHAAALARATGSDLTVAHVFPYPVPLGGEVPYFTSQMLGSAARAEQLDNLEVFARPAEAAGVRVRSVLLEGDPSRQIARLAEALPADLLVLGTHGRGGFERFLLGSVTEKLLRRAPCPVLTVCHGDTPSLERGAPFGRILCATDLRPTTVDVVEYALSLAEASSAYLTLLHVLEGPEFERDSPLRFSVPEIRTLRGSLRQDARMRLRLAVPDEVRLQVAVRDLVAEGRAHEEILRVARQEAAQLIVLGSHGGGALERMLFGSTSHHVVREAPCPVLVVRALASSKAHGGVTKQAMTA
ncbi:MAG TPA: universal stress protein [Vicinamibacteria bacterium]|nr:universal stress protein [Vicinamibacteria bacterium]